MKHFARLQARGYPGTPVSPPFVFNLTSKKYFEAARKRGKLRGLVALRGFEEFTAEGGNDPDAAIILDYALIWPAVWNGRSSWSGSGLANTSQTLNAFGGSLMGLAYTNHKANAPAKLTSSFSFLANQPIALRAEIFNAPQLENDVAGGSPIDPNAPPKLRHRARFGSAGASGQRRWQLTICDGSFELARLSANWSEAAQAQLDALEDISEPSLAQEEQIEALRGPIRREEGGVYSPNALFESVDSLSLGSPVEHQAGKFYELLIIPEPRGRLNVILSGSKAQHVEIPEVLASAAPGTITGAGPLEVWTNGGAFLLQVGRPRFKLQGRLHAGPFRAGAWHSNLGQFLLNAQADSAAGDPPYDPSLPGTGVLVETQGLDALWFEFRVTLSTTNNAFTPFLYSVQTSFPGLPRPDPGAVVWDSSAPSQLDAQGHPPIEEVEWSCDGANRRTEARVRLRDVDGATFASLPGSGFPALENRVASLSVGPSLGSQIPLITSGLVKTAQLSEMASALDDEADGVTRAEVATAQTQVILLLQSAWALLDESKMREALIGDGMRLGAYIRLLLQNAGFTDAELVGVSPTFGRILPRAALGEGPCVVPNIGQSRGDYIRQVLDRWGMGASLVVDEGGVWRLGVRSLALRSTTLHSIEALPDGGTVETTQVIPFAFSSDKTRNSSISYPGRFAILSPLDYSRDFEDFFNFFRVEGALDPQTGQRLAAEWTIHESLSNPNARNFLGRLKEYDVVRDEGLRTIDDVLYVLRSLVFRYGQLGRFVQFESYWHPFLFPEDRVLVDGRPYSIKRINGGSLEADSMIVVAQELAA